MNKHFNPASTIKTRIVQVCEIPFELRQAMFDLFARYYADVDLVRFGHDLETKDFVLILENEAGLIGFTAAKLFDFDWRGEVISVLFSGDTIVDRAFWGEQALARAWLSEVGRISRSQQGQRLVWFLIVKGHRTYRYLPVFAHAYVPSAGAILDDELTELREAIASSMFGSAFDPGSGVIRFDTPHGRLRNEWAEPTERECGLSDVTNFLSANPGYRAGDELACLCDLTRTNMRARARRWFDLGWQHG